MNKSLDQQFDELIQKYPPCFGPDEEEVDLDTFVYRDDSESDNEEWDDEYQDNLLRELKEYELSQALTAAKKTCFATLKFEKRTFIESPSNKKLD